LCTGPRTPVHWHRPLLTRPCATGTRASRTNAGRLRCTPTPRRDAYVGGSPHGGTLTLVPPSGGTLALARYGVSPNESVPPRLPTNETVPRRVGRHSHPNGNVPRQAARCLSNQPRPPAALRRPTAGHLRWHCTACAQRKRPAVPTNQRNRLPGRTHRIVRLVSTPTAVRIRGSVPPRIPPRDGYVVPALHRGTVTLFPRSTAGRLRWCHPAAGHLRWHCTACRPTKASLRTSSPTKASRGGRRGATRPTKVSRGESDDIPGPTKASRRATRAGARHPPAHPARVPRPQRPGPNTPPGDPTGPAVTPVGAHRSYR